MDVQQTRFFVKPVWCPHCTEKLLVHVRVQTEPAQRGGPQTVECRDSGDVMTIYILDAEPDWEKFATCNIFNRIDRAKDVAPIRVISSESREWKDGSGYEVEAWSAHETYRLACVQGAQSPCVSVAPATYRGVRDGSELRLCDQELNLTVFAPIG
jgi:hypothetical protein